MGLATSHGCYNGSCGSFNHWRAWVADQIGFALNEYGQGYCGDKPCVPWSLICHPLVPLLNHSDCEGELKWEDCGPLADTLTDIIRKTDPEKIENNPTMGQWSENTKHMVNLTQKFANGCKLAYENKENVIFS